VSLDLRGGKAVVGRRNPPAWARVTQIACSFLRFHELSKRPGLAVEQGCIILDRNVQINTNVYLFLRGGAYVFTAERPGTCCASATVPYTVTEESGVFMIQELNTKTSTLSRRILQALLDRGLTQLEIAAKLGHGSLPVEWNPILRGINPHRP
jgi:hypothetical protein